MLGLFKSLFSWNQPTAPKSGPEDLAATQAELERALRRVENFIESNRQQKQNSSQLNEQDGVQEEAHSQQQLLLEEDIVALHQQLGTGLSSDELRRLQAMLKSHSPMEQPVRLEEQVESAVLRYVFSQLGPPAWRRLIEAMSAHGLDWPIPEELAYKRTDEEVHRLQVIRLERLEEVFLEMGHHATADLLRGEVPVWLHLYPTRGGTLWRQTSLEAVAAGFRAQLYAAALELWNWRPPELETQMQAMLRTYLDRHCRGLPETLEQALTVTEKVHELCQHAVPQMVWEFLAPELEERTRAKTVAVLAQGVGHEDPVCKMVLTPELVHSKFEHNGKTYYFCRAECRKQFAERPQAYLTSS